MPILHTESSNGWGGQEMRILKEAEGMRSRGHLVIFAVVQGGKLVAKAREKGFIVYEVLFKKSAILVAIFQLIRIIDKHGIDLINTHSSLDAWIGGMAARCKRKKVIRTRHLSTTIRKGLNSRLLYNTLADFVVTTSSAIVPTIIQQSKISSDRCKCIATGVDPKEMTPDPNEMMAFRKKWNVKNEDCLIGTACIVRSWKGIRDFIQAAHLLREHKHLKWAIVGGGYLNEYRPYAEELKLEGILFFTDHLDFPFHAIAAMDIFALLSTAHEGISQSSLQAAYLEKPLITTNVGGLPEVCKENQTGLLVPPFAPEKVAEAVLKLAKDHSLRERLGKNAKSLIESKFTLRQTLDQMEEVYQILK